MGNFAMVSKQHEERVRLDQMTRQEILRQNAEFMMMQKAKFDYEMKQLDKQNREYRKKIRQICDKNGIPRKDETIICIRQDGKTHIYSRYSWFNKNVRDIIMEFCDKIGQPLVLDKDGNPTNDIEWHFESGREYHFIQKALEKHGYV